jgi:GNAT superfamily N-acetyltransferase
MSPSTLQIRPMVESDIPAGLRLSAQAGWNQLQADWLRLLRLFAGRCLGGCVDGRIVATATLSSYGDRLGWVGMVLVDQEHRRRGYGTTMLDAVISLGQQVGIPTLGLDATDLGRPLYEKRGFVAGLPINRWMGEATARTGGGAVTPGQSDWNDILSLDRELLGVDRSPLLRMIAVEAGVIARIVRKSGQLAAFAPARPGRTASHIGPVIARNSDAAALVIDALLDELSRRGERLPIMIDIPGATPLEEIAAQRGFSIKRRLTRMFRPGVLPNFPPSGAAVAASGFELG